MAISATSAHAGKVRSIQASDNAAKKACALGNYQKGAEILIDLLIETGNPVYIHNQARCYQQNNLWEQAISRFREYLRKAKDLSEADRVNVENQIADCEANMGRSSQVVPPPASATPIVPPPDPPVASTPLAPSIPATPPPAPPARDQVDTDKRLRIAGIVCAAVGLAALGAGVGLALKTRSISEDELRNGRTEAKESQRRTLETLGWVGYGVGVTAIATGAVLYLVGWPSGDAGSVALLPAFDFNQGSLILKGSF